MSATSLRNVSASNAPIHSADDLLKASALQAAAPIVQALASREEELRVEAVELFKQLNSGQLDQGERCATLALLTEILFPDANAVGSAEDDADEDHDLGSRMDQEEATFAENLRRIMEQQGITQEQLAAKVGVGQPAISMMLQRNCRPQKRTVLRIAEALGVSSEELWPPQALNRVSKGQGEFTCEDERRMMSRISHDPKPAHDPDSEPKTIKFLGKAYKLPLTTAEPGIVFEARSKTGEDVGEGHQLELLIDLMKHVADPELNEEEDVVIWHGKKAVGLLTTIKGKLAFFTRLETGFSLDEPLTSLLNQPSEN